LAAEAFDDPMADLWRILRLAEKHAPESTAAMTATARNRRATR